MKGRAITIWDGVQYRQVSAKEANRLVEKDMAQIMPVGGTEMKFRRDFTGYQTREVRAQKAPESATTSVEESEKVEETPQTWQSYRKAAADNLDQPVNKTTKNQTLAYMEQELGIEV